jgi:hypothetical protein
MRNTLALEKGLARNPSRLLFFKGRRTFGRFEGRFGSGALGCLWPGLLPIIFGNIALDKKGVLARGFFCLLRIHSLFGPRAFFDIPFYFC